MQFDGTIYCDIDGAAALVSSATHDEPAAGTSEIVLDDDYLDGIDLTGKELVVSIPNDPNDAYRVARVVRNTANTLWINDPGTYSAGDAIDAGRPFVVYDFEGSAQEAGVNFTVLSVTYLSGPDQTVLECTPYFYAVGWTIEGDLYQAEVVEVDPGVSYVVAGDQTDNFTAMSAYVATPPAHAVTKGTGGEWTGSPTYASSETTFTDSGADFQAYMTGWLLQPDVELPSYLEIVEVVSATAIKVKGDADTLATSGSTYRLHAPPGVDRETGALITGLEEAGSHWLWAGYEYVPPMVGFHNPAGQDPGIYGAQSGGNKVGSYHCRTQIYDPSIGRWTTPDPNIDAFNLFQDETPAEPKPSPKPAYARAPKDQKEWNTPTLDDIRGSCAGTVTMNDTEYGRDWKWKTDREDPVRDQTANAKKDPDRRSWDLSQNMSLVAHVDVRATNPDPNKYFWVKIECEAAGNYSWKSGDGDPPFKNNTDAADAFAKKKRTTGLEEFEKTETKVITKHYRIPCKTGKYPLELEFEQHQLGVSQSWDEELKGFFGTAHGTMITCSIYKATGWNNGPTYDLVKEIPGKIRAYNNTLPGGK